jgi:predicted enzyme related to lactoylglutathione lyase
MAEAAPERKTSVARDFRLERDTVSDQDQRVDEREGSPMHGAFIWTELLTGDVEAAKAAYAKLAGWTYKPFAMPEGGTYWVAHVEERPVAGIMSMHGLPPGAPPHWFAYLGVDDVDASCAVIRDAGGRIDKPPFDIPDVGRIAVVFDPQGACFGMMTPLKR